MTKATRNAIFDLKRLSTAYENASQKQQSLLVEFDNLDFMRAIPAEQFDLIYLDPPFCTGKRQQLIDKSTSDKCEYDDRWTEGFEHYLEWMKVRLTEIHRLLKPTGTLFLHLDNHASHYLKIELDRIFGAQHFINEIIWHYTGGGRSRTRFSKKHDTIFWYGKSKNFTFNIDTIRQPYKSTSGYAQFGIVSAAGKKYLPHPDGTPLDDVWEIPIVNPMANERIGYPTQKPEQLLERIIQVASNQGDLIGDFFCGSGTTLAVAERCMRKWVGCDASRQAIDVVKKRLTEINANYLFVS